MLSYLISHITFRKLEAKVFEALAEPKLEKPIGTQIGVIIFAESVLSSTPIFVIVSYSSWSSLYSFKSVFSRKGQKTLNPATWWFDTEYKEDRDDSRDDEEQLLLYHDELELEEFAVTSHASNIRDGSTSSFEPYHDNELFMEGA